jgi:CSLREA domain-containing protein
MKKTKIKFTTIKMTLLAVFASLVLTVAAQAATYTVNQINDSGDGTCDATCTLRDAILTANAAAGNDVIEFDAHARRQRIVNHQ